jgi:hypothetical protein
MPLKRRSAPLSTRDGGYFNKWDTQTAFALEKDYQIKLKTYEYDLMID